MEARRIRILQGYGPCCGQFSFTEAEIYLKPGEEELTVDLGGGFEAKFMPPPKPTKKYTFAEAYVMMRAGKWMKPIGEFPNSSNNPLRFAGHWRMKMSSGDWPLGCPVFSADKIEAQWEEAS